MGRIKAGIIVFLGTNCEKDTKLACDYMGWESEYIFQDEKIKSGYDIIFLPGGFSYGDYVSSGRLAKLTPAVKSLPIGEKLIVGICNGFQILCEAEILPGALTHNSNMKFISKNVNLEFNNNIIKLQEKYVELNNKIDEFNTTYSLAKKKSFAALVFYYDQFIKISALNGFAEETNNPTNVN